MPIITCKHCGAKYSYKEQSIPMRDKDSEECEICHNTLMSWNGGTHYYDFQLIGNSNTDISNEGKEE